MATPLPAGIKPSGSSARTGVRMWFVSFPAFFWALRSKAWATSLADPSPPTQTTLENKKLRMQQIPNEMKSQLQNSNLMYSHA